MLTHISRTIHLEGSPLIELHVDINPHLSSWLVFDLDLALVHLILHKEVFRLDVLGALAAGHLPIHLDQDCRFVSL